VNDPYLDDRAWRTQNENAADPEPPAARIEAFAAAHAAALDLGEQEIGAQSKRVACHTLVLAKRITACASPRMAGPAEEGDCHG
jgi:hypothetical protein